MVGAFPWPSGGRDWTPSTHQAGHCTAARKQCPLPYRMESPLSRAPAISKLGTVSLQRATGGEKRPLPKTTEALECPLSLFLGAVGFHGCHCPSQSRVSLPAFKAPVLQEHHEGAFYDHMCGKRYKLPGPLQDKHRCSQSSGMSYNKDHHVIGLQPSV